MSDCNFYNMAYLYIYDSVFGLQTVDIMRGFHTLLAAAGSAQRSPIWGERL